ncbi:acetylornithine transaminase [Peribacillus loiseleuriae]|uniref:Acetylornithine aminotransferase n=1 Tax=Peribacillus loiseleuriae TaxID=1679170 RepID=A0A0K9GQV0_9BACI|nr:acetylornithine transaminase [Peribacillus loiseleuriae]KMY49074.1 acetylornithine aminotransferase [Peribacillus loiseleuriae]
MSSLFPTYDRWQIEPDVAKGSWLTSKDGMKYLDYTSGIGVLNLGHCHEKVKTAVEKQLASFWHTSNMFENSMQEKTASLITEASGLGSVFFCNSGAEANEAAIKLARKVSGKNKIITCIQSFHGRTFATMAATGQEKVKVGFGKMLEEFHYIPFNDTDALVNSVDANTAAIMIEIVQGEGGIHKIEQEFLDAIKTVSEKFGILLIIDEIQTGIGRTGKPFAFQHYQVDPDIITIAKGLGNGLPIGAMVGKKELAQDFGPGSHGSTFGGNPVSIAAAEATIQEVFKDDFLLEVVEKGNYLFNQLNDKLKDIENVKEIRGLGLMIGIELVNASQPILLELQKQGILVLTAGPNVIRLLPPLTTNQNELDICIEKIANVIGSKQPV